MKFNEKENSLEYWDNIHSKYERNEIKLDDWLDKFETIIDSCSTPILDLGCGSGNDTLYLINKNKQVISCDQLIILKKTFQKCMILSVLICLMECHLIIIRLN